MKTSSPASLAVFSGLAAMVTADALPAEDIPIQCATICGPMIELTSACDVHHARILKRRRVDEVAAAAAAGVIPRWVPKLAVEPKVVPGGGIRDDDRVEKRDFSVIVPAPTSFPPDVVAPPTSSLDLEPTSQPTRINPVVSEPSSTNPPSPSLPPTTTTAIREDGTTAAVSSTASLEDDTNAGDLAEQKGWAAPGSTEEQCVCLNTSFDVATVAALCASCISQSGDVNNNVDIITATCNFSAQAYSPDKDAVVDNVRVEASLPASAWGENAAMEGAAARTGGDKGASMAVVMMALGVAMGVCTVVF